MAMVLAQKRFFAFRHGAPNIHTLRVHPSRSKVLVTTDRDVQQLSFDAATEQYLWEQVAFSDDPSGSVDVIASGVIACPGRERIVVAYAEVGDAADGDVGEHGAAGDTNDKLFLSVVDTRTLRDSTNGHQLPRRKPTLTKKHSMDGSTQDSAHDESKYSIRFELVAAPTMITSVRAKASTSEFNGVILFRMESMVAIGFVDDDASATPSATCVRLSNEQFAAFFPEFAQFHHPVLNVDTLQLEAEGRGWIAMGCADGFLRVYSGTLHDNILAGPYEVREMHMDGPVMSVSLFTNVRHGRRVCNLVAACAIGHAIVYEDIFGQPQNEPVKKETLAGSEQYESIFSALAADMDLDGETELLIGTDNQCLLAYKRRASDAPDSVDVSPSVEDKTWAMLGPDQWQMRAFGGVYSLVWLDLNGDGVNELVIASSTGVYIYEADPFVVLQRLEALVGAAIPATAPQP